MVSVTVLGIVKPEAGNEGNEEGEDANHLYHVVHRVHPYLLEESVACSHLNERPEDNDVGESHTEVSAPLGDVELLLENHA